MQKHALGQQRFSRLRIALVMVGVLGASGCSASAYAVRSTKAARSVEHARRAQAGDFAVYQLTLAEAYLEKAREESSHAAYQDASQLAKKSKENAEQAVELAKQARAGGR